MKLRNLKIFVYQLKLINICINFYLYIFYLCFSFTENVILKDIVSRTQHSSKAINEVIGFIENDNAGNLTDN